MSEVYEWSGTAILNSTPPPDGAPEDASGGVDPGEINAIQREMMASTRRWYENPEYLQLSNGLTVSRPSANVVRIASADQTSIFLVGARVKMLGGAAAQYGFVSAAAFTAGNTDLTIDVVGGGAVDASTDEILIHIARTARSAAFRVVGTGAGEIPLADDIRDLASRTPLVGKKTSVDQSITGSGTDTQITLTGTPATDYIELTEADTAADFFLTIMGNIEKITASVCDYSIQVHVGALGTKADAVVYTIPIEDIATAGARTSIGVANIPIVDPPAGRRVSFSMLRTASVGGSGWKVHGSGTAPVESFFYATVEETF